MAAVNMFVTADYLVFVGLLMLSALIGVFYGCCGTKQKTAREFLMADRQMGILPICLSMLASFLSSVLLLGVPAEVYTFGIMTVIIMIGMGLGILGASFLYLPVFYKLQVTSAYEYLSKRFNTGIRVTGSAIYILHMVLYMAIVTYAPALALSQVTGLHRWGCVAAIGGVCVFYTSIGGMKAVMWTDAAQIVVMYASMLVIAIKGCTDTGGLSALWEKNAQGGRLEFFDFNPDPTVRHTFWSLVFGGFFTWLSTYGTNQAQVQRFLTSPTKLRAQIAVWLNVPGFIILNAICCFVGLVLYARYWNCDPVKTKQIEAGDQMLPLFVMELLGDLPGLPGLFVAGVFSGALSTLSSGLNSLAAVTLEDFVKVLFVKEISEEKAGTLSKILAVAYGFVSVALVAAAEQLGNITQATLSIFGMISGPVLGVFTLGMFFPWANSTGAAVGLGTSFGLILWIGIGAQVVKPPKPFLPVSTNGCESPWNVSLQQRLPFTPANSINSSGGGGGGGDIFVLYRLSYLWYSVISCMTVIIVGLLVSAVTGLNKIDDVDPELLSPLTRWLISLRRRKHGAMELVAWKVDQVKQKEIANDDSAAAAAVVKRSAVEGQVNPSFVNEQEKKN